MTTKKKQNREKSTNRDLTACNEKGIVVCGTESSKTAAAELAWALILASVRRIAQHDRAVREGRWVEAIGTGLSGKVLGVLGPGKLGAQVARIGLAFGMKVISWSQNLTTQRAEEVGTVRVEKNEFFATADIISIHVALSERTRGLVGAHEIGLMKTDRTGPVAPILMTGPFYRRLSVLFIPRLKEVR